METTRRKITEVFPPLISQAEIDSVGDQGRTLSARNARPGQARVWAVLGVVSLSIIAAKTILAM